MLQCLPMRLAPLLLSLALSACSNQSTEGRDPEPTGDGDRTATAGHEEPTKAPEKAPAKAPAAGPNYEISTTPQGPFKVGGEGRVDVRLAGRNGYHVNQEFPIELALQAPEGAKLAKTKLVRGDATTFEEAQAVFAVAVTPESPGRKALHGTLNFSVCNPQNCLLERQDVSVEIEATP